MSQSFIKKPDNGPHSALGGLGVLSAERAPAEWLLYEHDDGRHAVAPSAEAATFAHGDPAWHRLGPVAVYGVPVVDGETSCGKTPMAGGTD